MLAIEYQYALEYPIDFSAEVGSSSGPDINVQGEIEPEWLRIVREYVTAAAGGSPSISAGSNPGLEEIQESFRSESSSTLMETLNLLYHSGEHHDVVLVTSEGVRHRVHSFVLSAHSEYFSAHLSGRWRTEYVLPETTKVSSGSSCNSATTTLSVVDCDARHLRLLLEYLYMGRVGEMVSEADLVPCLLLAHRLMVRSLVTLLGAELRASLDLSNAAELYVLADRLALKELKVAALHLLVLHHTSLLPAVLETHLSPHERASLEILSAFYHRARNRGLTVDRTITRISEILAISEEVLRDTEERFLEARQQNDNDIAECESALAAFESSNRSVVGVLSWLILQSDARTVLMERLARLNLVRDTLRRQESHIDMQRQFLARQTRAYERLSEAAVSRENRGSEKGSETEMEVVGNGDVQGSVNAYFDCFDDN